MLAMAGTPPGACACACAPLPLQAGKTVSVYIYPALTDFTHVELDGTRKVLPGEYTFKFGVAEAASLGQGYAEHKVSMV